MYGDSNMETYITICKVDSQWESAVLKKKREDLNRYFSRDMQMANRHMRRCSTS